MSHLAKIHELSENLANQIAAGEVIERPASVVKELVENAIDAHSTQIDIRVVNAGLAEIEVIDNGDGIEADDVLTAFKRHSTSKLLTQSDLFKISTLGFRGEALASIASVTKLTLITSTGDGAGSEVIVKGGEIKKHEAAVSRKGTDILVKDLFYNTPARLKYVKSMQTELAKIGDIVNRLALSHPQISFTLTNDQNQLIKTNGTDNLQQTIAGIYGVANAKQMLAVEAEDLDFKLNGYIGLPEYTRASRNYISLLINGRYIRNYQLNKAIIKGYGSKLMIGRYPVAVLAITMDPILIDVNVHPTKLEVRLSKETELMNLIETTIKKRLVEENLIPEAMKNLQGNQPAVPKRQDNFDLNQLTAKLNEASKSQIKYPNGQTYQSKQVEQPRLVPKQAKEDSTNEIDGTPIFERPAALAAWDDKYLNEKIGLPFDEKPKTKPAEALTELIEDEKIPLPLRERFPSLVYLAQLHGTYLLASGDHGFYIIDQHAAQERIKYEYYREAIGEVSADLQHLLVPIVLEFSAAEMIQIQEKQAILESVGVYLEAFGQNSVIVHEHPTWFKAGEEESILREIIDYVLTDGKIDVAKIREKTAIMMSCKRSIKANHHLDDAQAKQLLIDLSKTQNPFNCPHGRPVLVSFSDTDLEKMFKRIQESHTSWQGE